ncbi:MAG: C4-dicarboxylate ABC transporter, partial [Pseudomonadota bacterium]
RRVLPISAVPEAVSKKVIDGAVIPFEVTLPLKMSELVGNHAGFKAAPGLYTATFVMTMNKAKYDSLPADLKKVIDDNSGPEVAALFGAVMDRWDIKGRKTAQAAGNTIVDLDAQRAEWVEAAKAVEAEWIAEMDGKGFNGAALVKSARELIAKNAE